MTDVIDRTMQAVRLHDVMRRVHGMSPASNCHPLCRNYSVFIASLKR